MAIKNRSSALSIMEETEEGELVYAASAEDFLALQSDFEFNPNFEQLDNEEIRASIGRSKPISGLEQPSFSMSHYFRNSGVEGTPPNFRKLVKAVMGTERLFYSPMVVSTANNKLNFTNDDGTFAATIASGTYKTPQALATAVAAAMNTISAGETHSCVYSTITGKFTISCTGTLLSLLWKTGANGSDNTDTHIGTLLGYSDAADDTGTAATTGYVADNASNGIERVLDSGSTISNLITTVAATEKQRGDLVLVKDGTNGYSLRFIDSRDGVNLVPGFNLPGAPAAGVRLGQTNAYHPANEGHPTLSAILYRGNPGLIEALAGGRVTAMSISIAAGQIINANYTVEGVKYFFNPIEITASTRFIDWTDDDGTHAASVPAQIYRDPHELAQALQDAMNSAAPGETATVAYSDTTGRFNIKTTGTLLSLLWNTGANAANSIGTKLGFSVAANDTGTAATTGYNSDNALSLSSPFTPSYDNADANVAKANEVLLGDADDLACFCASNLDFQINLPKENVLCVCAESGVDSSVINEREVTITGTALIEQYDADKFRKFRANDTTKFQFTAGVKSGGNWVPGKAWGIYMPTSVISSFQVADQNGLAILNFTLTGFVGNDSGGEVFIGFA